MWNHSGIIWNSWTLTFEPTGLLRTFWENRTQNSDFRAWGEYAMFWHFIGPSISRVNHISYHVISLLCQMIYDDIYDDIISFSTCTSCVSLFFHHKSLWSLIGSEMVAGGAPPPNNIRPSGVHRAHRECPRGVGGHSSDASWNSTSKIEIDRNCNDQKDQKDQNDQRISWSRHCNAMSCNGLPGDFDEFRVNFVSGTLAIRKYRRKPQLINEYNTL